MVKQSLSLLIFTFVFCSLAQAQDSAVKLNEEMARTQAAAAQLNETNARLAADSGVIGTDAIGQIQAAAKRAQEAADRAQDAASKAKQAVDSGANSAEAASAIKAQEYANEAQDYANRAQQILNLAMRGSPVPKATFTKVADDVPALTEAPPIAGRETDKASALSSAERAVPRPIKTAAGPPDFNEFINRRFDNVVRTRIGPKNNSNQNETPSISANSTSLV
ncbi:MAG TPA: hypothetical protein VJT50_16920, partial [Pyrinomonadaceae bacterium]|nr:hypothetical protein [Pyrinomonadaceae bacterium]